MVEILEKYEDNEYIVQYNDTVVSIKSRSFEYMSDLKIKELIHLLKFYDIKSCGVIDMLNK